MLIDDYNNRRRWSDKFTSQLLQILSNCTNNDVVAMKLSSPLQDIRDGYDVQLPDGRLVGLRIRTWKNLKFAHQFTLRADRNMYGQHEAQKIESGALDLILYCFANEAEDSVATWKLFDAQELGAAMRGHRPYEVSYEIRESNDGYFFVYNLDQFPDSFVIARGG